MRSNRASFDTGKGFYASRPFAFDGETFALGDPFPWEKLGCSESKLRQLWERRRIECGTYTPPKKARAPRKPKETAVSPAGDEAQVETDGESTDNRFE